MNKIIATTSINPPTKAFEKFAKKNDWNLIIAGDIKTPEKDYKNYEGFLSVEAQKRKYPELSALIGWNCIQRRNIAILEAINLGADFIALVDDDNIPTESWGDIQYLENVTIINSYKSITEEIVMDPFTPTNYRHLWHRGFPIQKLNKRDMVRDIPFKTKFDILANFWNGDPDIDAICRMEHAPQCEFNLSVFPFCFKDTFSPFNSQNTILSRAAAKQYFLFPGIGRMDDIWASYKLESEGFKVLYDIPTVFQERNKHDLTKDFKDEYLGYTETLNLLLSIKKDADTIFNFLPYGAYEMYLEYKNEQR